jgi:hypothetical protein
MELYSWFRFDPQFGFCSRADFWLTSTCNLASRADFVIVSYNYKAASSLKKGEFKNTGTAMAVTLLAILTYGWVGHIYAQKCRGPGTKGFALISFLPSGVRSTQKVPGAPARCQASFLIALNLFTKTFLIGSINRV